MDEKLISQLRYLLKYISRLKEMAAKSKEEYMADDIYKAAAERYLQLAIETCINIGNRIAAREQLRYNFAPPETYAEVFERMQSIGLLPADLATRLKKMAQFRNKLVHGYWEIDDEIVYWILQENLADIEIFIKIVTEYVNRI